MFVLFVESSFEISTMRITESRQYPMKVEKVLSEMGTNIKLARLRRKLAAEKLAERAGVTRVTLTKIESGSPTVAFGLYAQVLLVLGLEEDLIRVAQDDKLGRKIQDAGLVTKRRAPKRKSEEKQ